ncbi:hypothetical protein AC249_AIPGENE13460 [Exaiptasia diaphana]|nr:hypothetical protein AC249_AIPGENE13460 [Exaiptasia diaphana]
MSQEERTREVLQYQYEPIAAHNWTAHNWTDIIGSESDNADEMTENQERLGNVDWCSCGNCAPMSTVPESVCCVEDARVLGKMVGAACITCTDDFLAVCTNKAVIETAFNQYLEQEGFIDDEPLNELVYTFTVSENKCSAILQNEHRSTVSWPANLV